MKHYQRTVRPKVGPSIHSVKVEAMYHLGSKVHDFQGLSMRMNFRPSGPFYTGTVVKCFETNNAGWIVIEDDQQNRHILCIG